MASPQEQIVELAPGNKLTLAISDIAFGGEGVARLGDFVVFVPFVVVGEEVEVEITEVKRRFARAQLLQVLKPSPDRVTPACRYFGDCGGCQYQHMAYDRQISIKHKQVADCIARVGGFSQEIVDPVIPCPSPYGYRNRIMIRSQWNKPKQALNIGFIRTDNRLVVDIDQCQIAEPVLNQEITRVRQNPPPRGGLKVVLRTAPEGWELPRDSFFQNNFHLLPKLVETVRDRLNEGPARYLIDAYCGVGFFSVEVADCVETFLGIEIDKLAIQAARINAENRNRTNGSFEMGSTEELLPLALTRFPRQSTAVILDPPRKGCPPETVQLLRKTRPAQIIYVSCHPATLARDLNVLCADGVFDLKKVVPLDMFPQTQHIECVADVRLRASELTS